MGSRRKILLEGLFFLCFVGFLLGGTPLGVAVEDFLPEENDPLWAPLPRATSWLGPVQSVFQASAQISPFFGEWVTEPEIPGHFWKYNEKGLLVEERAYVPSEEPAFFQVLYTYGEDSRMIRSASFDVEKTLIRGEEREFDAKGRLVERREYSGEKLENTLLFSYDAQGNLLRFEKRDAAGDLVASVVNAYSPADASEEGQDTFLRFQEKYNALGLESKKEFDHQGRLLSEELFAPSGLSVRKTFRFQGAMLVEEREFDFSGGQVSAEIREYTPTGKLQTTSVFGKEGELLYTESFAYQQLDLLERHVARDGAGKILWMVRWTYDQEGNMGVKTRYNGDGDPFEQEKRSYDPQGRLVSLDFFRRNATLPEQEQFVLVKQLQRKYSEGPDFKEVSETMVLFDDKGAKTDESSERIRTDGQGRVVEEETQVTSGKTTVKQSKTYAYDQQGRVTAFEWKRDGKPWQSRTTEYHENGQKKEEVVLDGPKKTTTTQRFDEQGNLLFDETHKGDEPLSKRKYEYLFDAYGNWTQRTLFSFEMFITKEQWVPKSVITREFSYFE